MLMYCWCSTNLYSCCAGFPSSCYLNYLYAFFFFSSRRRHTRFDCDWSSDVCSSDLIAIRGATLPDHVIPDDGVGAPGPDVDAPPVVVEGVVVDRCVAHAVVHCEEIGRASCRERV